MRVALLTTFAATRKEPLGEVVARIHKAFADAGLPEPEIRFNFGDAPLPGFVSSVDRVLKRHPELKRFVTDAAPMPGIPGARRISNGPLSAGAGDAIPFSTLLEIASGVPRSFPFHSIAIHFHSPEFGEVTTELRDPGGMAGILVGDSWWVNGRNRSLSACTFVDADPASKKLPPLPATVAAVLAACGKVKKTMQAPLPGAPGAGPVPGVRLPTGHMIPSANPAAGQAVREVVMKYRGQLAEISARVQPHRLPDPAQAHREVALGVTAGPKKPALQAVFKPMGYSIRGESGTFKLRRKTPANLTAEVTLDVGTWSHNVSGFFSVYGVGFKGTMILLVSPSEAVGAQYPIGDATRWQKIVENLGALVAELERTFVPEIEQAGGPAPEWYEPER